ncbi:hypothetical protein C8024_15185 [Sphingopyxis sp. BSNA05]|nr:hypothetical protein [Sphingopyxis sp. BSNA05]
MVRLAELTGGQIIMCPGNHDVERTKANGDTLRMASQSAKTLAKEKPVFTSPTNILPHFAPGLRTFIRNIKGFFLILGIIHLLTLFLLNWMIAHSISFV